MPVSAEPSCCRSGGMGAALAPPLPPSRPQRVLQSAKTGDAIVFLSPGVSARARSKHGLRSQSADGRVSSSRRREPHNVTHAWRPSSLGRP
eukprot:scaffold83271_cov67-Phaeocystis_antarctica.AAC.2